MKSAVTFFENLFYRPKWYHWVAAFVLLPLSLLYGLVMFLRRRLLRPRDMGVPVVSVGNLTVGGSGKTPMTITLARRFEKAAVVLRGYGRKSEGLHVVSLWGAVQCGVETAGDEAMLLARKLPEATVIVAEDRVEGIEKAKEAGAKVVFLDDGFSKVGIEKVDLLLLPSDLPNPFPLPSGPFREFPFEKRRADIVLKEGRDFRREVHCPECDKFRRLLLVTAIANPARLEPWLPKNLAGRLLYPDHAWFDEEQIREKMAETGADALLVTEKDAVKLEKFNLPMARLELQMQVDPAIVERIAGEVQR
ncbi:tetraacyldisaccharide 4'-kinase [Hydrogenimonas sp. SS33]|uniref:tetraacyldisaccharide 4'-kinase n=1 Tax=Hydrogenimonas leucolamina TaxID=2954236 RepID=UPI00336BC20E